MKTKITRFILIILLIMTFIAIFEFSNQTGGPSSSLSKDFARKLIDINIHTRNLDEYKKELLVENSQKIVRKGAHLSIYTLVGILMMSLMYTYKNIDTNHKFFITILVGFLYACSDELHQRFVPGRASKFTDVLIDTCGCLLGSLIIFLIHKIYIKIRKSKEKQVEN